MDTRTTGLGDVTSTHAHIKYGVVFRVHRSCDDDQERGHTPAPRMLMEEEGKSFRRMGWMVTFPVQGRPRPQYPREKHGLICYHCYEKGHSAPMYILSFREMPRVLRNYQALSLMERLGITSKSYLKVKKWFEAQTTSTPSTSAVS